MQKFLDILSSITEIQIIRKTFENFKTFEIFSKNPSVPLAFRMNPDKIVFGKRFPEE